MLFRSRLNPFSLLAIGSVVAAGGVTVAALAATGKFEIAVGAYPEPHPDAADPTADVRWLKRKLDAGATAALTQVL